MNKISGRFVSCLLSVVLASQIAIAQDSTSMYAGVAYAQFDSDDVDFDDKPSAIVGILGTRFTDYIAVETRLGAGIQTGTFPYFGARGEYEITSYFGVFLRGSIPAGDGFNLYGIVGYGKADQEASVGGFGDVDSESGVAYGAGAELSFGQSKQHSFGVEWTQYVEDTSALGIIYRVKF